MTDEQLAIHFASVWEEAARSPDPSSQNAVLILRAFGTTEGRNIWCNNAPTYGIELTPERLTRPAKYDYMRHAEEGAIVGAARLGFMTSGSTMFALWAACAPCARMIVGAGIKKLYRHGWYIDNSPPRWRESIARGDEIMLAGEVEIIRYDGPVDTKGVKLLFDGTPIDPWSTT